MPIIKAAAVPLLTEATVKAKLIFVNNNQLNDSNNGHKVQWCDETPFKYISGRSNRLSFVRYSSRISPLHKDAFIVTWLKHISKAALVFHWLILL